MALWHSGSVPGRAARALSTVPSLAYGTFAHPLHADVLFDLLPFAVQMASAFGDLVDHWKAFSASHAAGPDSAAWSGLSGWHSKAQASASVGIQRGAAESKVSLAPLVDTALDKEAHWRAACQVAHPFTSQMALSTDSQFAANHVARLGPSITAA